MPQVSAAEELTTSGIEGERRRTKRPIREWLVRRLLPPVARGAYRALAGSWRYTTENEAVLSELLRHPDRPVVGAFLHARTFQLLYYFSRPLRGRWMLMCSRSSDGDLMASVERHLGYRVARGSSGSGGARALAEIIRAQRHDRQLNSCLAVDGSRGPRGIVQPGILTLARRTGGILLPVAASTGRAWVLNSWDRTVIPKPRAQVRVAIGAPIEVPARMSELEGEALRGQLQLRLLAMHEELDRRTGFTDSQPLQYPALS